MNFSYVKIQKQNQKLPQKEKPVNDDESSDGSFHIYEPYQNLKIQKADQNISPWISPIKRAKNVYQSQEREDNYQTFHFESKTNLKSIPALFPDPKPYIPKLNSQASQIKFSTFRNHLAEKSDNSTFYKSDKSGYENYRYYQESKELSRGKITAQNFLNNIQLRSRTKGDFLKPLVGHYTQNDLDHSTINKFQLYLDQKIPKYSIREFKINETVSKVSEKKETSIEQKKNKTIKTINPCLVLLKEVDKSKFRKNMVLRSLAASQEQSFSDEKIIQHSSSILCTQINQVQQSKRSEEVGQLFNTLTLQLIRQKSLKNNFKKTLLKNKIF